jgi:hypothetical protein
VNYLSNTRGAIIKAWNRIAAFFASDVRRTDQQFSDLGTDFDRVMVNFRTSTQKNLAAESHALHARIAELERALSVRIAAVEDRFTGAEKELAVKIENTTSAAVDAATVHLSTLILQQAAHAEFSRIDTEIAKHAEAIRHLDATKRTAPNVKGGRPELLN